MSTGGAAGAELLTQLESGVLTLTLNRPDRLNAFAGSMRDDLAAEIESTAERSEVRVIVITGAGRAFCAGADVSAMAALLSDGDEAAFQSNVEAGMRAVRAIAAAPQPVIAAVNGVAVGAGAALAIACDFRIASDAAKIGFTFNRIGLHPDWGATYHLPRLVGAGRAAELIASARLVAAQEAAMLGIFEIVAPDAEFPGIVTARAAELASSPPLALALAKQSLAAAAGEGALEESLQRESEAQLRCFRSADVREGVAAFREKRIPVFTGH